MNWFGKYKSLFITSVSLLFMASSCPMQFDPFDESGNNVGSLGFYINGSPVVYRAESAVVKEIEGTDSLMICSAFILGHYGELVIKFAKEDMSLEKSIKDPDITLRYLYSVFVDISEQYGDDYEWQTLKAESGELSFTQIGDGSVSEEYVLAGNFKFEGIRSFSDGSYEKISATDGVFNLEVSRKMIR